MASERITTEHAHVLLDAVTQLRVAIKTGPRLTPWEDYEGDSGDPKITAAGYTTLLDEAEAFLGDLINHDHEAVLT